MTGQVLQLISACKWSSVQYLFVSQNVFDPLIYYSHLFPLVASLVLAIFIYWKGNKTLASKVLIVTIILLDIWLLSDLVVWATDTPSITMFFWALENMIEPMIYAGFLYFIYLFIGEKDISFNKKLVILALLIPTVVFASTKVALLGYDLTNCDRDAIEGPLVYYGYLIEIIYILWILSFSLKSYFQKIYFQQRQKIVLITVGVLGFLVAFSFGNIIGSLFSNSSFLGDYSWAIGQYGLFGVPVFLAFLSYLIVRYKILNIKLIGTQALVAMLWIILFAMLFVNSITIIRIIVPLTLILFLIVGILLVRSVLKEVKQKEQIAQMAEHVERAYETEKKAKEDTDKAYMMEKQAKEELQKLDKVKDQFLQSTQHDLRTPLTSLMGYSDLLLNGTFGKQTQATAEVIQKMQVVTQNMIRKVNNFLDTTQFQLGKNPVSLKPDIPLLPILDEIINELQFKAKSKNIYLKFQKPVAAITVSADREKLKSALFNVVDNSVKYTPQGGVTMEIKNEGGITIIISDTGIGMSPESLKTLFSRIFERDQKAKDVAAGSGIGLYLATQIIKAHNGQIWAESKGIDQGSVFYVKLPMGVPDL